MSKSEFEVFVKEVLYAAIDDTWEDLIAGNIDEGIIETVSDEDFAKVEAMVNKLLKSLE